MAHNGAVMRLESHGISTDLPAGWEGRIALAAPTPRAGTKANAQGVGPTGHPAEQAFPVAHLGNFPLPQNRGDFGSGAVDVMGADDVLIVLAEYGPECVGTKLFSHRNLPTELTPNMFSGSALQRTLPGQAGAQIWCTVANRAFCVYVVLGRQSNAVRVLPQAKAALKATKISPR